MKRLLSSVRKDVVLQYRAGFYAVGATVALMYVGILSQVPKSWPIDLALVIPLALLINALVTTFYFIAALAQLERSEGTLTAMAIAPLRVGEYLGAKVVSLTILAVGENALVVLLLYGTNFAPVELLLGIIMLCAFYTLAGFIAISRFHNINSFLIPSGLVITALLLPPLVFQFQSEPSRLAYLHPLQPYLSLLNAAFSPRPPAEFAYGVVAGSLWLVAAYRGARNAYARVIS